MQTRVATTVGNAILASIVLGVAFVDTFLPNQSSTSTTSSVCTENGAGTVGLTVIYGNSNDTPAAGLPVTIEDYDLCGIATHSSATTDANGSVYTSGWGTIDFLVRINNTGPFNASAVAGPQSLTCVTLSVPSGNVVVRSVSLGRNSSCTNLANTTICVVPDTGGGVYLQLISSTTGEPLNNVSVVATPKASSCYGFPPYPQPIQKATNGSGWIALDGLQANYYYNIELTFQNTRYNFTLPQGPGEFTLATYSLPGGNLSVNLCFTQPQQCYPYTSSSATEHITLSSSVTHG